MGKNYVLKMKFFQISMYIAVISSLDTFGKAAINMESQELGFSKLKNKFYFSYVGTVKSEHF